MKDRNGELILKKNSVLYCSSCYTLDEIIEKKDKIKYLYYVFFHPSNFQDGLNLYKITLKRDISLFFDIEFNDIFIREISSYIKSIANNSETNELLSINLKKYNFDGYYSNFYSYYDPIITLFNNLEIFDIEYENYNTELKYDEKYNSKYSYCFIDNKSILNINKKYEICLNKNIIQKNIYPIFYNIITNAQINYNINDSLNI